MKTNTIYSKHLAMVVAALFLALPPAAKCQSANVIPLIQFNNVPITAAIQNLARQANLNYIIDPKLSGLSNDVHGNVIREPDVTFTWTNMSASDALSRLLKEHNRVMVQDKFTTVTLITGTNHVAHAVDASLLVSTNAAVPVFRFDMVPLDQALKSLIEHDHLNVALDPKITTDADPPRHKLNVLSLASISWGEMPTVSFRWENLTAKQALVALCEAYDLVIVKDAATGAVSIKPRE